jgi:hypothetical protein
MTLEILPDSRARDPKGARWTPNGFEIPIYCSSCHVGPAGWCPEETPFLFYICNACYAKHGEMTNVMFMPDEVFFREVAEAQVQKYGHALNAIETEIKLGDPESLESRLARDRKWLTPNAGA